MSSSQALCCLLSVKKHKHDFNFSVQCIQNNRDIQNNQGLGKGYQPQPSASANNPYFNLHYSRYHKNLIQ